MTPVLGALLIFVMRVTDMSLDTLRMLMTMQGRKYTAAGIGVAQATVFILAVSQVLKGPLNVYNVLGYALGFGTGVLVGMIAEERLALGYNMFRIYSSQFGEEIAAALRKAGFGATEFIATGRDGFLTVVNCAVNRRDTAKAHRIIDEVDRDAFIIVDRVQPLQRGYFRAVTGFRH